MYSFFLQRVIIYNSSQFLCSNCSIFGQQEPLCDNFCSVCMSYLFLFFQRIFFRKTLCFRIILQKRCKENTKNSCIPPTYFLIIISHLTLLWFTCNNCRTNNSTLLLTKLHTLFKFHQFFPDGLFLFQYAIQNTTYIQLLCLLVSPALRQFLRFTLLWINLTVLFVLFFF